LLSGELFEDQFEDYLVWRDAGSNRKLILAIVDYKECRMSGPTLRRILGMDIEILRFAIDWRKEDDKAPVLKFRGEKLI